MKAGIESAILSTCIELSGLSKSESELEVVSYILTLIILLLLIILSLEWISFKILETAESSLIRVSII